MNTFFTVKQCRIFTAAALLIALGFGVTGTYAKPRLRAGFGNAACCDNHKTGLLRANDNREIQPSDVEKKFRPYLEQKLADRRNNARRGGSGHQSADARRSRPTPTQKDYMQLLRVWDGLSPEFHALYNEATSIPAGLDYYISPMGKFRIYYTTVGYDQIHEPTLDAMGYGTDGQPSTWREKRSVGNGVPDFIDEIAFAFDSSWSMHVDRFGFAAPLPDSGAYYRVHVFKMEDYDYGATIPRGRPSGASHGFASIIELNGDWTGEDARGDLIWGPPFNYNIDPYPAVRVTAAHELFHAVQYATAWNIFFGQAAIDDYPLAWLEGSATLMEELAFPEVDDYLQYIGQYFSTPDISLLNDYNNYRFIYTNSILFKYLYEKTAPTPRDSIGFIKTVMDNKFKNSGLEFFRNLEQTSQTYSLKSWAEVLNGFHAESYFTGNRAKRPQMFVSDAELIRTWSLPDASSMNAESKTVRPHAAAFFRYTPQPNHPDTLYLNISGQNDPGAPGATWAASVLVIERADSVSLVPVQISGGQGAAAIENWKLKNGCVLVVTNASPQAIRQVTVTPSGTVTIPDGNDGNIRITVTPNVVKLRDNKPVRIAGGDIAEVKLVSTDGKVLGYYNMSGTPSGLSTGKNAMARFQKYPDGAVEWYPNRVRNKPIIPGAYYILAAPLNNRGKLQRIKIMVLP